MDVFVREHFVRLFVCVAFQMDKREEKMEVEMDIKDKPIGESHDYILQSRSGNWIPHSHLRNNSLKPTH